MEIFLRCLLWLKTIFFLNNRCSGSFSSLMRFQCNKRSNRADLTFLHNRLDSLKAKILMILSLELYALSNSPRSHPLAAPNDTTPTSTASPLSLMINGEPLSPKTKINDQQLRSIKTSSHEDWFLSLKEDFFLARKENFPRMKLFSFFFSSIFSIF